MDNGRESVDSEGVIHGLRPLRRKPDQLEDLLLLAAAAHPAVLVSLESGRFVVAEEDKPHITYDRSLELSLTLTAPLGFATLPEAETPRHPAVLFVSEDLALTVLRLKPHQ